MNRALVDRLTVLQALRRDRAARAAHEAAARHKQAERTLAGMKRAEEAASRESEALNARLRGRLDGAPRTAMDLEVLRLEHEEARERFRAARAAMAEAMRREDHAGAEARTARQAAMYAEAALAVTRDVDRDERRGRSARLGARAAERAADAFRATRRERFP